MRHGCLFGRRSVTRGLEGGVGGVFGHEVGEHVDGRRCVARAELSRSREPQADLLPRWLGCLRYNDLGVRSRTDRLTLETNLFEQFRATKCDVW